MLKLEQKALPVPMGWRLRKLLNILQYTDPPPTNNDLAQKVNSPEEPYYRLFKFPSPDGQK